MESPSKRDFSAVDMPTKPSNYLERTFNVNDVTGTFYYNGETKKPRLGTVQGEACFYDKNGNKVTRRGYLFGKHGNIITKQGNVAIYNKDLDDTGDFPPLFSIERYNFSG